MTIHPARSTDLAIDPDILGRWSSRSFTGEALPISDLMIMIEAARWAPSAFNAQPWHFIHARRGSPSWDGLVALINPFNRSWAQHAAALIFVASKTTRTTSTGTVLASRSHSFDAGAAWALLAMQATKMGWAVHPMQGFDQEQAPQVLGLPDGWKLEIAIAVGRRGDGTGLSEDLKAREKPSQRKPITDISSEGRFPPALI
ncbi:Nitroreductase [Devosia lucknowensis]|uniref:Nitroreductase n=1 Tax=Devosia lucknowensis TaxID=1096929 RepID=A0A1Y6G914_9HYPH|nr:nitroreductase family protein [Devosia lucknowensis]SMQ85853.1 Nitroreductase [Devosia lucknowensis]